ncbi:MAG: GNAT family N-acetyltransferase [Acidimicrobiales bacterium]
MFERFTERSRQVLVLAREEARLLGHHFIGTEHLLLGLIRADGSIAAQVLAELGVELAVVRERVAETIGPPGGPATGSTPFTPFTPRAKKVLEPALRELQQSGGEHIGTEYILLGLIREGEGVGAQILLSLDIGLADVRQRTMQRIDDRTLRRIRLRRAEPEDERQLAALDRATWSPDNSPAPLWDDSVDFYSSDPVENVIVADSDEVPIGYVKLRPTTGPGSNDGLSISGIAVRPDHQRQGLGGRLLEEAIDEARRRGARRLTLHVLGTNTAAIRLYESHGFAVDTVQCRAFQLDERLVDDVVMTRIVDRG